MKPNSKIIPNEAAFMQKVVGHCCEDVDFTLTEHPQYLTLEWICQCGWAGFVQVSAVKAGRFGRWIETREGRKRMTRMTGGALVIEDERRI